MQFDSLEAIYWELQLKADCLNRKWVAHKQLKMHSVAI